MNRSSAQLQSRTTATSGHGNDDDDDCDNDENDNDYDDEHYLTNIAQTHFLHQEMEILELK